MKRLPVTFAIILSVMVACSDQPGNTSDPLNGSWRLVDMQLVFPEGQSMEIPAQESLFIFADGYYSICYAFGDSTAVPYAERWHPSDRERLERFNSIIVNSGSYQLSGSRFDVQPLFALAPEFKGGKGIFSYTFLADTLELIWEKSIAFDGLEYPSRGTVTRLKLIRVQ